MKSLYLLFTAVNEKHAGSLIFVVSFENTSPVPCLVFRAAKKRKDKTIRMRNLKQ